MCPTREFRSYYSVVTRAVTSTAEVSSMCRSRSPGQRRYAGAAAVWPGRLVLPVMSRSRNSADDCSCGKPPDSRKLRAYEAGKRLPQRFDPVPSLAAPFFGRLRKALTAWIEEHHVSADQDAMDGRRDLPAHDPDADPELSGLGADPTAAPTIYDVARAAGVSIASVSRVLNGQRNPRQETRERVLAAVAELGFVPDGAARALSARLKEVVGVIVRRPGWADMDEDLFADEAESLQYPDLINRGIEAAAQRRGFDLLIRSVDITEHDPGGRTLALARKSDGLILHDRVLEPDQMDRLSR